MYVGGMVLIGKKIYSCDCGDEDGWFCGVGGVLELWIDLWWVCFFF